MMGPRYVLERKPTLFGVVAVCTMGILAVQVIMPHILHGFHIVHILLHAGGITMAAFLAVLGIMAYCRMQTRRLALTAVGFSVFVAAEAVTLVDATWPFIYKLGPVSMMELDHLLLLLAFGMISVGVFRND